MLYSRNTGENRLHPEDASLIRGVGVCRVTGGEVDLSLVTVGQLTRRVQREDAKALRKRLKRERKPRHHARKSA
jgi:hypothetical protein